MARALDASHFKPAPRTAIGAQPSVPKLAAALADACTSGLQGLRSAPWRVTAEGLQELAAAPSDAEGRVLRFESERGSLTALMVLDRQAVSAVVEAAFGGTGSEPSFEMTERPLSRIETRVLQLAQQELAERMALALGAVLMRPFSLFEGDTPEIGARGGFAQFRFVLNVFSYSGEMTLTFARDELEREIDAAGPLQDETAGLADRQRLQREIGRSDVALAVTLGPEMLTLDALSGLRPGKMIALSASAAAPVTVWSGGVAAYEATLGRSGERYAITITTALT